MFILSFILIFIAHNVFHIYQHIDDFSAVILICDMYICIVNRDRSDRITVTLPLVLRRFTNTVRYVTAFAYDLEEIIILL